MKGRFRVTVPPKDDQSLVITWFVVVGLTKAEDFDKFLEHPEHWTWAQIETRTGQGMNAGQRFHPKGQTAQLRGRILGPDKKPLEGLRVRFLRQTVRNGVPAETSHWMHWGYDPCTGRFWALRTLHPFMAKSEWRVDLRPYSWQQGGNPRLAPVLGMAWPRGKDVTIEIPLASHVKGSILGLADARHLQYHVTLTRAGKPTLRSQARARKDFRFSGLPGGTYSLEVGLEDAASPLFVQRGLVVKAGEELELPAIDVSDRVRPIQVSVQTAEGDPINAMIWHVTTQTRGSALAVGRQGRNTGGSGRHKLLVPKTGIDLCVSAKGFGPRVFSEVHQDLDVTLVKPHRVRLQLVGLDKRPELLKDLYVRAQPISGYPSWAWQVLEGLGRKALRRGAKPLPPRVLPALARLDGKGVRAMAIPSPGRWRFELAYFKKFRSLRIPLPDLDSVDIQKPVQDLTIQIPSAILKRAREKFEALLKKE